VDEFPSTTRLQFPSILTLIQKSCLPLAQTQWSSGRKVLRLVPSPESGINKFIETFLYLGESFHNSHESFQRNFEKAYRRTECSEH
jgi:hypothetical protein